jgi:hypothetical protein
MDWLNDTVQALQSQEEQFEADLEALGPKPTNKARGHSGADLNTFITRHRHHVAMLERVLRLLENDQVAPEEVETALKDSMEYYLESSTEPDFMADDDMYEGLPVNEVRLAGGGSVFFSVMVVGIVAMECVWCASYHPMLWCATILGCNIVGHHTLGPYVAHHTHSLLCCNYHKHALPCCNTIHGD